MVVVGFVCGDVSARSAAGFSGSFSTSPLANFQFWFVQFAGCCSYHKVCQKGQLKLRHKTTDSSLTLNAVEIYRFVVCLKLWIPGTTRQGGDHQLT